MVETSFYELKCKNVINIIDGRNLGHICDIVIEICSGTILGFVVPCNPSFLSIFKGVDEIFIPYQNVCKIGKDTILVELVITESKNFKTTKFSDVSTYTNQDNDKMVEPQINKNNSQN